MTSSPQGCQISPKSNTIMKILRSYAKQKKQAAQLATTKLLYAISVFINSTITKISFRVVYTSEISA